MRFELDGKVIEIFDVFQVNETFRKREFVIEHTETSGTMDFSDQIKFQLTQDRCSLIDNCRVSDEIKVSFRIRGRRWEKEGKVNYFTNLEAWKIEKIAASRDDFPPPPPISEEDTPPPDESDDLPF